MSLLENFEIYTENIERPFITLRNQTITFSKSAIENLHYSAFVHMLVNSTSGQVAFQACEKDDTAIKFYSDPVPGKQKMVRLNGTQRSKMLMEIAGTDDCGKGLRFYGKYYKSEDVIIFDLRQNAQNQP